MLSRLVCPSNHPFVASQRGGAADTCYLPSLTSCLVFERVVLMNHEIMGVEELTGTVLLNCKANFIPEESLSEIPRPI